MNYLLARELPLRFEGRVLAVDAAIADRWGRLVARAQAAGRPAAAMDAWLAAAAEVHAATLATRNVGDFEAFGIQNDPGWQEELWGDAMADATADTGLPLAAFPQSWCWSVEDVLSEDFFPV